MPSRNLTRAVLATAAVLAVVLPATAPATARDGAARAPDEFTALSATVLDQPHPVAGPDGAVHLVYELIMINSMPVTVTVDRIEVLDAGRRDKVVADLRGAALDGVMSSLDRVRGRAIGASRAYRAMLDVRLPAGARPRELVHRLTVTTDPPLPPRPESANPFLAARVDVAAGPATVVDSPLRGHRWVQLAGCCDESGHRGVIQTVNGGMFLGQRFAVDLTQMDAAGRLYTGPADQLTSFPPYGAPVLSATGGVVVTAVDGRPDQVPFQAELPRDPEAAGGNNVIVRFAADRYAYYAHLKPGSLRVAPGDRVRAGQQLGQVGNSGFSDWPHLHFQLMDGPSALASNGLPFALRAFDSEGSVPPLDQIDITGPIPIGPELSGHHERVITMNRQVVNF